MRADPMSRLNDFYWGNMEMLKSTFSRSYSQAMAKAGFRLVGFIVRPDGKLVLSVRSHRVGSVDRFFSLSDMRGCVQWSMAQHWDLFVKELTTNPEQAAHVRALLQRSKQP